MARSIERLRAPHPGPTNRSGAFGRSPSSTGPKNPALILRRYEPRRPPGIA